MSQDKAKRSVAKKEMQSMPDNSPVISAGMSVNGSFSGISVFGAEFPDDSSSFEINGEGVNLSILSGRVPDGFTYLAHFTKISIPEGSDMLVIAYGF